MPRCPNCFYSLVLLEHRRKYKCAKCGKLFLQKDIDSKEFREWNKKRRKEDKEKIEKEFEEKLKKKELTEEEKKERKLEYQRKYMAKNREAHNKYRREYWAKHRERLLKKRKENYEKRKAEISKQQKEYRENNKTLRRINHLRHEQKKLAVLFTESLLFSVCTAKILSSLPTLLLS